MVYHEVDFLRLTEWIEDPARLPATKAFTEEGPLRSLAETIEHRLTFGDYTRQATITAIYPGRNRPDGVTYCALGLVGEAGETANAWKKVLRDDEGRITPETRLKLLKEIGDVLWYAAMLADELNSSLEAVARLNSIQLNSRQRRGTLRGSGDDR